MSANRLLPCVAALSLCQVVVPAATPIQRLAGPPNFGHWLDLAEQHQPGQLDASVVEVRGYPVDWFGEFENDLKAFTGRLQEEIRRRSPATIRSPGDRQNQFPASRATGNVLLRKVALLLMDVVTLPGALRYVHYGPQQVADVTESTLALDGTSVGTAKTPPYLSVARAALARIQPAPGADGWTRDWYRVVGSHLLLDAQFTALLAHLQQWQRLAPHDPAADYLEGRMYEVFSTDRIQIAVAGSFGRVNVPGRSGALGKARDLLDRLQPGDQDYFESRVRLAHVLWEQGDASSAVSRLMSSLSTGTGDRDMRYLAYLFLGRAQSTVGNESLSRSAYREALRLFPTAQSPAISLLLAGADTEIDAAVMFSLHAPLATRDDPWVLYYSGRLEQMAALMLELRSSPLVR